MRINYPVHFNGECRVVKRTGFESVEQFKAIAEDMVRNGLYITEIYDKYNIDKDYPQVVSNTFKSSPGQLYMIKLIIEEGIEPHPVFYEREVGKNIKRLMPFYKPQKKVVRKPEKSEAAQIVDQLKDLLDDMASITAELAKAINGQAADAK